MNGARIMALGFDKGRRTSVSCQTSTHFVLVVFTLLARYFLSAYCAISSCGLFSQGSTDTVCISFVENAPSKCCYKHSRRGASVGVMLGSSSAQFDLAPLIMAARNTPGSRQHDVLAVCVDVSLIALSQNGTSTTNGNCPQCS